MRCGSRTLVRVVVVLLSAAALAGCAGAKAVLSSFSSAISGSDWLRARTQAGLQPRKNGNGGPLATDAAASGGAEPHRVALEEAYRRGVQDAIRQLTEGLGRDPRWTWVAPIVQEVWIPAQVRNGVFIPGHREWVMIRPGQWQAQFGLPLGPPPSIPAGAPLPAVAPAPGGR